MVRPLEGAGRRATDEVLRELPASSRRMALEKRRTRARVAVMPQPPTGPTLNAAFRPTLCRQDGDTRVRDLRPA